MQKIQQKNKEVNKMLKFKNLRIYNGCNHAINYYEGGYTFDRQNNAILNHDNLKPTLAIPKDNPLNITHSQQERTPIGESCLFLPGLSYGGGYSYPVDNKNCVLNQAAYDIVTVSSHYANHILQCQDTNQDYIDRLYQINPVYSKDGEKLIGCCGFRKVTPLNLDLYLSEINNGYCPSFASVKMCLHYYAPYRNNLSSQLSMLENYLTYNNIPLQ
jgi:hypothetical protein